MLGSFLSRVEETQSTITTVYCTIGLYAEGRPKTQYCADETRGLLDGYGIDNWSRECIYKGK